MRGKKWDLLAQKGLKWVSDRIHALELTTGQRQEISTRFHRGLRWVSTKTKLQAKLESHCFANPPNGWSGREQRLKAPNHHHGAAVKAPLGAHEHSMIHQKQADPKLDLAGTSCSSLYYTRPCTRHTQKNLLAEEERWGMTRGERRQPLPVQESSLQ